MQLEKGQIIVSSNIMDDPNFIKSAIFISEFNEDGAMGFVLNHLFPRKLNDLVEFSNAIPFPLFEGGPCGTDQLYFIHQRPDLIEGGLLIKDSIYLGGNFNQAIAKINSKEITIKDLKLFIGYCGWETNQLEDEIKGNYWNIVNTVASRIFSTNKMDFDNLFLCLN